MAKRTPIEAEYIDRSPAPIPIGPPLHLEAPGRLLDVLRPFIYPERVDRLQGVLAHRTRHITVLLERVHDVHNIGACLRTCEAAGVQDLHIVPASGPREPVPKMISCGAFRWLTLHYHPDTATAVARIRAAGYRLAVTDMAGDGPPMPVSDLPITTPICVAFGNEHGGISEELRSLADQRVQIPMHGFVESLNISVAFAVAIFDLRRKVDAALGEAALLTADAQVRLLDQWVLNDVPRGREVLLEIVRRAQASGVSKEEPR